MVRRIIHVDMDEFFAAVEKLDNPALRGKCLLVGGDAKARGVVSTASYEARRYGCHSAMPMATAIRLCPHAIVLGTRPKRYQEVSEQVFEILGCYTPLIEPLSIDEAFLDVTGCERLLGPGEQIAADIRKEIRRKLSLTASVGGAPPRGYHVDCARPYLRYVPTNSPWAMTWPCIALRRAGLSRPFWRFKGASRAWSLKW